MVELGKCKPFITAEVGTTFEGSFQAAMDLVKITKDAGADAVKFIFWFPDEIMVDRKYHYEYQNTQGAQSENMYDMLQKLRLPLNEWKQVKQYADELGITFFATVNSPTGIEWVEELQLKWYKLSSWDFNYPWLWREIGKTGKPVIIDTGPVVIHELMESILWLGHDNYILVHTTHAKVSEQMNMRTIPYLKHLFNCPVGYSASGRGLTGDIMALALGADFLEKRVTTSLDVKGHHQHLALPPDMFKIYVSKMREVEVMLGVDTLIPSAGDLEQRKKWFRMWIAMEDIRVGEAVTTKNTREIRMLEQENCYEPNLYELNGVTAIKDIKKDTPISSDNVVKG